jgi:hypothetical protein
LNFEETCSHLVSLYDIVKRGDAEHMEEATNQIQEITKSPESILFQINVIKTAEDPYITTLCIIILNRLIPLHIGALNPEQIEHLKLFFVESLGTKHEPQMFNHICDGAAAIIKAKDVEIEWPEIFQIAQSLMESSETVGFGIHLWGNIFAHYQGEDARQHLFSILSICSQILESSENLGHRKEAHSFIQLHMIRIEEFQSEEEKTLSDQILQQLFKIMTTGNDNNEIISVVNSISFFFAEEIPFFEEFKKHFIEAARHIINDAAGHDINTRILVHNIIEAAAYIVASEMQDELVEIITESVQLSLEACQADRESLDYIFPLSFFYALSTAYDAEKEEIFGIFFQIAEELIKEGGHESKQVGLLTLSAIIEGLQEVIALHIEDFLALVLEGSANPEGEEGDEDEILIIAVCSTIRELTDFLPDSLNSYVEQLTAYLIERSYINDAITALDNLYYRVERPPMDLEGIATALMTGIEEASSYRIEAIISCLTSSFSHATVIDETVFESLAPFLTGVLESKPDLKGPVFECYGRIAHISPQSILSQLGEILDSVEESFSISEFPVEYSCICIEQLAEVFSVSMAESVESIVPPLFAIIQDEKPISQSAAALKALAKLLGLMPGAMSDYSERIIDYLMKKPFEDTGYMIPCCEGIAFAVDGFKYLELDPGMVITTFLPVIRGAESKDTISGILMLIGTVCSVCVTISPDIFEFATEIFMAAVSGQLVNLKRSDASEELDPQLMRPLCYALNQFLRAAGPEQVSKLIEALFEAMRSNLASSSILLSCYTLNVFSHICSVCNLTNELFNITFSALMQLTSAEENEIKRVNMNSFLNLMRVGKEQMQSSSQAIFEYSLSVIQCDNISLSLTRAAVSLFCATFTTYSIEVDQSFLSDVMTLLPPPIDSDEIVDAAAFATYLIANSLFPNKVHEIVLHFLASSDWHIHLCDPAIVAQLTPVTSEFSKEMVAETLRYNEKHIANVYRRLSN